MRGRGRERRAQERRARERRVEDIRVGNQRASAATRMAELRQCEPSSHVKSQITINNYRALDTFLLHPCSPSATCSCVAAASSVVVRTWLERSVLDAHQLKSR